MACAWIVRIPNIPLSPFPHGSTLNKTSEDLAAEGDDADFETEHDARRRRLAAADPVHNVDLRQFFQGRMAQMAERIGQQG